MVLIQDQGKVENGTIGDQAAMGDGWVSVLPALAFPVYIPTRTDQERWQICLLYLLQP